MRVLVRCNNDRWAYDCYKVLEKRNLFNGTGTVVPGIELHFTNGDIRYVVYLADPNNIQFAIASVVQHGWVDLSTAEWSEVVADEATFNTVYRNGSSRFEGAFR